jgi:hypothetical protein
VYALDLVLFRTDIPDEAIVRMVSAILFGSTVPSESHPQSDDTAEAATVALSEPSRLEEGAQSYDILERVCDAQLLQIALRSPSMLAVAVRGAATRALLGARHGQQQPARPLLGVLRCTAGLMRLQPELYGIGADGGLVAAWAETCVRSAAYLAEASAASGTAANDWAVSLRRATSSCVCEWSGEVASRAVRLVLESEPLTEKVCRTGIVLVEMLLAVGRQRDESAAAEAWVHVRSALGELGTRARALLHSTVPSGVVLAAACEQYCG